MTCLEFAKRVCRIQHSVVQWPIQVLVEDRLGLELIPNRRPKIGGSFIFNLDFMSGTNNIGEDHPDRFTESGCRVLHLRLDFLKSASPRHGDPPPDSPANSNSYHDR